MYSDFKMHGMSLANLLNLTEGTHSFHNEWVSVELEGRKVQVPLKPLGHSVSYDALAAVGLEEGVTLPNGDTTRLLTSSEWDAIYVEELHERQGYSKEDLGVGGDVFGGSNTWVVDDTDEQMSSGVRVLRGRNGVSNLYWSSASNSRPHYGWRVVIIPELNAVQDMDEIKYNVEEFHLSDGNYTTLTGATFIDPTIITHSYRDIALLLGLDPTEPPKMVLFKPEKNTSTLIIVLKDDKVHVVSCTQHLSTVNDFLEGWKESSKKQNTGWI